MIYIVDICYYVTIYFNLHACNNNAFKLLYTMIYIKYLLNLFVICISINCIFYKFVFTHNQASTDGSVSTIIRKEQNKC